MPTSGPAASKYSQTRRSSRGGRKCTCTSASPGTPSARQKAGTSASPPGGGTALTRKLNRTSGSGRQCPAPVSDARYRFPGSALGVDVASVGVDGVAGDPAGLLRSGEADGGDAARCRSRFGGPPVRREMRSALPPGWGYRSTEIRVPAGKRRGSASRADQGKGCAKTTDKRAGQGYGADTGERNCIHRTDCLLGLDTRQLSLL
jgi:hypothetical protein